MTPRDQVVAEAKTWNGTPFHHQGALKGIGADCATFPHLVYVACGLMDPQQLPYYPIDWLLHASDDRYAEALIHAGADEFDGPPQPGDFVLFKVGRAFSHGGIVLAWPRIIHCSRQCRRVLEADVTNEGELIGRAQRYFRFIKD